MSTLTKSLFSVDQELDNLFRMGSIPIFSKAANLTESYYPPVDMSKNQDSHILTFDVPGMEQKDITIEVKNQIITVSGERKRTLEAYHQEINRGKFSRSISLPETCNLENISATLTNGVLTIEIARKPQYQPKKIEIKTT